MPGRRSRSELPPQWSPPPYICLQVCFYRILLASHPKSHHIRCGLHLSKGATCACSLDVYLCTLLADRVSNLESHSESSQSLMTVELFGPSVGGMMASSARVLSYSLCARASARLRWRRGARNLMRSLPDRRIE